MSAAGSASYHLSVEALALLHSLQSYRRVVWILAWKMALTSVLGRSSAYYLSLLGAVVGLGLVSPAHIVVFDRLEAQRSRCQSFVGPVAWRSEVRIGIAALVVVVVTEASCMLAVVGMEGSSVVLRLGRWPRGSREAVHEDRTVVLLPVLLLAALREVGHRRRRNRLVDHSIAAVVERWW